MDNMKGQQDIVFTVPGDQGPALGTRLRIAEAASAQGRPHVGAAVPDPDGGWKVFDVGAPDADGAVDVYLTRVVGPTREPSDSA